MSINATIDHNKCLEINEDELKNASIKANDPHNPDSNNGLITSIWGPHEWESLHAKTFGYPIKPTEQQKQDYLNYFIALGNVLPCIHCRKSYNEFIKQGNTKLDMTVMESRETLSRWGFNLHNTVNKKLGVDYGVTYDEICYKYDSYRAQCSKSIIAKGCLTPLDEKARAYQKADLFRAPLINVDISNAFIGYAESLGYIKYRETIQYYASLKRNSKEWTQRDCVARKLINHMRKNGIGALDENNKPTIYELMLLSMLSSTLDNEKLQEIIDLL